ncbi:helix-turn-helix-type transcriptional regulator [Vibrio albus]|uniref:Helix-turn-helix-type transcriptional regulator n=1 Tax=Vibrio albus TaxID=2200953 RepID=A0A2U3B773_9VIBR|nr:MerR family transcriptional regulator [Vibrio albus]PWI32649.1 helix-turn-helix-type transcriptional regulator [Vibrio albus]
MKLYAIRDVSEMTGIKPVTLRAWQRRYGLIQPQRTETGHRMYSEENLERIRDIQGWLAKGVSIGKVKALLENERQAESNIVSDELEETAVLLEALAALNGRKAESVMANVLKEYPFSIVLSQCVEPVQRALASVKSPWRTLQNGLFQALLHRLLHAAIEAENRAAGKGSVLFVSLDGPGSVGALFAAAEVAEKGLRVTFLDGVEEVSGLATMTGIEEHYQQIRLFANRTLPSRIAEHIQALETALSVPVICSGLIEHSGAQLE